MPEKMITVAQHMKLLEEAISDIFDPNNEANIIMQKKLKEITEAEITRRVKEEVGPEREAVRSELDRLQHNHDKLLKTIECTTASHQSLLQKIGQIQEREENSTKLYETMVKLTANLHGTSEAFGRMLNLLEAKTRTKKDVV